MYTVLWLFPFTYNTKYLVLRIAFTLRTYLTAKIRRLKRRPKLAGLLFERPTAPAEIGRLKRRPTLAGLCSSVQTRKAKSGD